MRMRWSFDCVKRLGLGAMAFLLPPAMLGQTPALHRYAHAAHAGQAGVHYAGPGRGPSFTLPGSVVRIGLWVPLRGPRRIAGEAIVRAASLALRRAATLRNGKRIALAVADSSGPPWGRADDRLLRLIFQQHVAALVTSANGALAHLGLQVGNKMGVPILTLSGASMLTKMNMPWIFRLAPSDAMQARAMVRRMDRAGGPHRVLLVSESDVDGRAGRHAFQAAIRGSGTPIAATEVSFEPQRLLQTAAGLRSLLQRTRPRELVLWAQPEAAAALLRAWRLAPVHPVVYLPQLAAQPGEGLNFGRDAAGLQSARIYTPAARVAGAAYSRFVHRFRLASGFAPGPTEAEAYIAVRMVAQAITLAGANRARVRDRLVHGRFARLPTWGVHFDAQGSTRTPIRMLPLGCNQPRRAHGAAAPITLHEKEAQHAKRR